MAGATGPAAEVAALHGTRLEALLDKLVDTHVRGAVYEAAGGVDDGLLASGAAIARERRERFRMQVEVVEEDPAERESWNRGMVEAVERVLAA